MLKQFVRIIMVAVLIVMGTAACAQVYEDAQEIDVQEALSKSSKAVADSASIQFDYSHISNTSQGYQNSIVLDAVVEKSSDSAKLEVKQQLSDGDNLIVDNNSTRYFVGNGDGTCLIAEGSNENWVSERFEVPDTVYNLANLPQQLANDYEAGLIVLRTEQTPEIVTVSGVIKEPNITTFEIFGEPPVRGNDFSWKVNMNIDRKTFLPSTVSIENGEETIEINYKDFSELSSFSVPSNAFGNLE